MTVRKKTKPRKLLVASIGLATLTIGQGCFGSGNLVAPPPTDSGIHDSGPRDSGVSPRDSGVSPRDSGVSPRDSGVSPLDSGVSPLDGGAPEDAAPSEDGGPTDDAGALDAG